MTPAAISKPNRTRVILAFAAVYLLWGSTYLFIKYAIETIPPFLLGASRFFVAGVLLYVAARWCGAPKPTRDEWRAAAITGVLMLAFGNGAVMWAEKSVPSGVVALIVSSVPIWIVVLDWLRPNGRRPRRPVLLGLVLGFAGMVILVGPRAIVGQGHIDEVATGILLAGSVAWAVGTLVTRVGKRPGSPIVFAALQMLAAAVAMLIVAFITREPASLSLSNVSMRSFLSWGYLVIAGSIIGYTAYVYLLGVVSATKAATYAYVNPIIAVVLGWAFANEPLSGRTLVAAAVILASVAIITATQTATGHTGEHPAAGKPGEPGKAGEPWESGEPRGRERPAA
ncbi:MAG: EamA family transporter [Gemmatimonadaceae bacterium]